MRVCWILLFSALALGAFAETPASVTIDGKLTQRAGQAPALATSDHKLITLDGDEAALKVLNDKRLNGFDLEARGHFTAPDHFMLEPNHARSVLVRKDGHLKMITYWCETCAIRTYEPGPCMCCQRETRLDVRDPDQE